MSLKLENQVWPLSSILSSFPVCSI